MPDDPAQRVKALTEKFLARQLYVIHTVPKAPREEIDKLLPEHLQHQIRLEKDGIMFAAGPMLNEDGKAAAGKSIKKVCEELSWLPSKCPGAYI